ncbi:MAG: hypothetical protein QM710_01430 [Flavobacterium sp.]
MAVIAKKIRRFSDRELACFYHYRLSQYTKETQAEIKAYIFGTRKLSESEIPALLLEKMPKARDRCKCCGSKRIFEYDIDDEAIRPMVNSGWNSEKKWKEAMSMDFRKVNQKECFVCGYKPKNHRYLKSILFILAVIVLGFILDALGIGIHRH